MSLGNLGYYFEYFWGACFTVRSSKVNFQILSKDWPSESRQNVDFYVRPAFIVLVLPIKGFTAYYTAFNSSF